MILCSPLEEITLLKQMVQNVAPLFYSFYLLYLQYFQNYIAWNNKNDAIPHLNHSHTT